MTTSPDAATLATIGSIIAAFGASMLFFRIQRELQMQQRDEIVWLPAADWLLIVATVACLLAVLLPIAFSARIIVPAAAVAGSTVLVAGYIFAILAHYRIIFGKRFLLWGRPRKGPRANPEPAELVVIIVTMLGALAAAAFALLTAR